MNRVVILVSAYIAMQLLADISVLKIVQIGTFTAAAGIFTYPITFTLRDMVHKSLGKTATKTLILSAAAVNLFMAGLFWFISILPYANPEAPDWNSVLGPVWRIVLASIVAEVIAQFADTELYSFWVNKVTKRFQWSRILFSNFFTLPLDAVIFVWLAFGGTMPASVVWSIVGSNLLVKWITTLIGMPLIYLVPEGE